jgi:hypothetical protein
MASQSRDFEDRLKSQVHQATLKFRKSKCDECPHKGKNNFCQIALQFLPDFQLYRHNACPKKIWLENW